MKLAAWQYPIDRLASIDAWRDKLDAGVREAAERGAALLVIPEYAGMELTSLLSPDEQADLHTQIDALQRLVPTYLEIIAEAARTYRITVVGGSVPEREGDAYFNRARIATADGRSILVEKLQMTRFETERWGIAGGRAQPVVEVGEMRLGVAICYDAEFPLIVRRLVEAGANVIAVPSCTDGLPGYHRVRVAAAARALESQSYVVQAPTVGIAEWSIALDENVGAANVFGPPDRGFPDDGVIASGPLNEGHILVAEIDLARVDEVRRDGQVLGHRDWNANAHLRG